MNGQREAKLANLVETEAARFETVAIAARAHAAAIRKYANTLRSGSEEQQEDASSACIATEMDFQYALIAANKASQDFAEAC